MRDKKHNPKDGPTKINVGKDEEIIEGEVIDEGPGAAEAGETGAGEAAAPAVEGAVSEAEFNALAEELKQAREAAESAGNKAKEYFDGWQRERADFANYKRRVERDQQMLAQNIKGDIAKKYLGVLDDLERAMKNRPTGEAMDAWAGGIELIMRKIQGILESEGVMRIPAETEEFNPNRHEAITYEPSPDHESGEIIEVVQQGYMLGDRVLRPAMVRVAR